LLLAKTIRTIFK